MDRGKHAAADRKGMKVYLVILAVLAVVVLLCIAVSPQRVFDFIRLLIQQRALHRMMG